MPVDVFGHAIKDYYHGNTDATIAVLSHDFEDDEIPVSHLFRNFDAMPKIEQKAMALIKGKVLDVGCGAGSHSVYINDKLGNPITAIDTSTGAIDIVIQRGVQAAKCEDFYTHAGIYDTILLLMNGSGIIGKLSGIAHFFKHLKSLLAPDGQVLMDSSDLIYLFENDKGEFWVDAAQGYYGEMQYALNYKNKTTAFFDWLYIDFNTLERAATIHGFSCELVLAGDHYDYLARLRAL